ncbi:unnamed protein product, partial [Ectocarpus fasciculatus]
GSSAERLPRTVTTCCRFVAVSSHSARASCFHCSFTLFWDFFSCCFLPIFAASVCTGAVVAVTARCVALLVPTPFSRDCSPMFRYLNDFFWFRLMLENGGSFAPPANNARVSRAKKGCDAHN